MMSIPEGATHKLTVFSKTKIENQIVDYFKRTDDGEWVCFNSRQNRWYLSFRDVEDLHSMLEPINSPQTETQSVYTKEMYEAGEECEVGMICQFNKHEYFYIGIDSCGGSVFERVGYHNEYKVFRLKDIKPIDTRTDKQKTIDEIVKFMNGTTIHASYEDDSESLLNKIINNEFEFLKYTGKDND